MSAQTSIPPDYFDALYAQDADPWRFASSDYERAKYAATLAALPMARCDAAFEVGCSIGVLTRQLAERCSTLLAVDVAEAALAQARRRCAGLDRVTVQRMRIPGEWPDRQFDLIVLSEVLYYLSPIDVVRTAARTQASLAPGGTVLLVHYTLPMDYPCDGNEASEIFIATSGLAVIRQRREAQYRLDLLQA
ncbi:MAG: SAM-dependent methyltransferase [Acetobacteraceae bacterium]|nr:SAM-dependent methyltransferase [Acetobacteraceae bacterium]